MKMKSFSVGLSMIGLICLIFAFPHVSQWAPLKHFQGWTLFCMLFGFGAGMFFCKIIDEYTSYDEYENDSIENPIVLTKEQALFLLSQGRKISHRFFTANEYITTDKEGNIVDENGYVFTEFWAVRTGKDWDTDYYLWE